MAAHSSIYSCEDHARCGCSLGACAPAVENIIIIYSALLFSYYKVLWMFPQSKENSGVLVITGGYVLVNRSALTSMKAKRPLQKSKLDPVGCSGGTFFKASSHNS